MSLWNVMGIIGALAIVAAYYLLQSGRWKSEDAIYSACNALGAALILLSLVVEPNLPSIVIESFWLLISLAGLFRSLRARQAGRGD